MDMPAVSMTPERVRMTADEYLALPETTLPMNLIDGELIDRATPTADHQSLVLQIAIVLKAKARALGGDAYIAPLDVRLDEFNVVQPDVLVILPGSKCQIIENKLYGAPDLVVEVLSPSTGKLDHKRKFALYERFGVREYWMVDPDALLIEVWVHDEVHLLRHGVYEQGEVMPSPLLGEIVVDSIFA
ncbi:MAG: Uma2 family endonuclease [Chloroflexota bacterium]|nr:Uma2 family endonuclease [Chloroflexota bacterium]